MILAPRKLHSRRVLQKEVLTSKIVSVDVTSRPSVKKESAPEGDPKPLGDFVVVCYCTTKGLAKNIMQV